MSERNMEAGSTLQADLEEALVKCERRVKLEKVRMRKLHSSLDNLVQSYEYFLEEKRKMFGMLEEMREDEWKGRESEREQDEQRLPHDAAASPCGSLHRLRASITAASIDYKDKCSEFESSLSDYRDRRRRLLQAEGRLRGRVEWQPDETDSRRRQRQLADERRVTFLNRQRQLLASLPILQQTQMRLCISLWQSTFAAMRDENLVVIDQCERLLLSVNEFDRMRLLGKRYGLLRIHSEDEYEEADQPRSPRQPSLCTFQLTAAAETSTRKQLRMSATGESSSRVQSAARENESNCLGEDD